MAPRLTPHLYENGTRQELAPHLEPCPPGCRCRYGEHLTARATRDLLDAWFSEDDATRRLRARFRGEETVSE
jgi:hypothetical protein